MVYDWDVFTCAFQNLILAAIQEAKMSRVILVELCLVGQEFVNGTSEQSSGLLGDP